MATEAPALMLPGCTSVSDNSSKQFYAVAVGTANDFTVDVVAGVGAVTIGILQNNPKAGAAAEVATAGLSKAVSHGTITAGDLLMTYSDGTLETYSAGSNHYIVGTAMQSAVIGDTFSVHLGSKGPNA